MDNKKINEIELQVGLLGKDVKLTDKLCNKLSQSVEKLQEVNSNLTRIITLHEEKHEQHEQHENQMKEEVKDLHKRIDKVEQNISSRIDALRSDLIAHKEQDKRVFNNSHLEKWKYMIIGGLLAGGFLLGKIDITTLLTFL